jgi:hypothetical protein
MADPRRRVSMTYASIAANLSFNIARIQGIYGPGCLFRIPQVGLGTIRQSHFL